MQIFVAVAIIKFKIISGDFVFNVLSIANDNTVKFTSIKSDS